MAALDLDGVHTPNLRPLERQILEEKAKGLSDLEVASKFFLYEREVRSIMQRLKKRGLDCKMHKAHGPIADTCFGSPLLR